MKELLNKLQNNLSYLSWAPDFITKLDSDPRWEAIRMIEKATNTDIDWEDTDFTSIGGEPIIIELGQDDWIPFKDLVTRVREIVGEGHTIIADRRLIAVLAEVQ